MNFAEGSAAAIPMIGRKDTESSVFVAARYATSAAHEVDRLVWRPPSDSRASDRVGRTLEVHNRL